LGCRRTADPHSTSLRAGSRRPPDLLSSLMALANLMRLSLELSPALPTHGTWNGLRQEAPPTSGCPILRVLCEGWDPRISIPTFAYPTLCKERKGWGTRRFMALPAFPNMKRDLFLLRKPHTWTLVGSAQQEIRGLLGMTKGRVALPLIVVTWDGQSGSNDVHSSPNSSPRVSCS